MLQIHRDEMGRWETIGNDELQSLKHETRKLQGLYICVVQI